MQNKKWVKLRKFIILNFLHTFSHESWNSTNPVYDSETFTIIGQHYLGTLRSLTEMRMLMWMCGVSQSDHMRNTFVRSNLGVRDVADMFQEDRLKWVGHVARRPYGLLEVFY